MFQLHIKYVLEKHMKRLHRRIFLYNDSLVNCSIEEKLTIVFSRFAISIISKKMRVRCALSSFFRTSLLEAASQRKIAIQIRAYYSLVDFILWTKRMELLLLSRSRENHPGSWDHSRSQSIPQNPGSCRQGNLLSQSAAKSKSSRVERGEYDQ